MTDYLSTVLTREQLQSTSVLALAHVGDGVYELLWRSYLCAHGKSTSKGLHRETVSHVRAPAQARDIERIMDKLSDDELAVYRRGRNAKVNSVPKNADISDYHAATGLETLFGFLYLQGNALRINQLFAYILEE